MRLATGGSGGGPSPRKARSRRARSAPASRGSGSRSSKRAASSAAGLPAAQQHVPEPRVQRQPGERPSVGGDPPARIQRAQIAQQCLRLGQCAGAGGGVRKARSPARAPLRQIERQPGQVRGLDLGRRIGGQRALLAPGPEPVAHPRGVRPARPRRCVASARSPVSVTSRDMPEPGSNRARRAGPPSTTTRIAVDRQRGFGDGGGEHDLADADPARAARAARCAASPAARRNSGRSVAPAGNRGPSAASQRRISPSPGRKTSTPPLGFFQRLHHQVGHGGLGRRAHPCGGARSQRVSTGKARPSDVMIGASSSSAATGAASSVADITRSRRSSRSAPRNLHAQREAEIGVDRAFVELVEDHRADAGQLGVGLHHAGQDALGHHLDPRGLADLTAVAAHAVADGLARPLAQRFGHAFGGGAGGEAAGLQHQDAAPPARLQHLQRHDGGLARAGRRLQHGAAMAPQRARSGGIASSMGRRWSWAGLSADAKAGIQESVTSTPSTA